MNTAMTEEVEALPEFIKSKIFSSFERQGRIKHAENMSAARATRVAELVAYEPVVDWDERWLVTAAVGLVGRPLEAKAFDRAVDRELR